VTLTGGAPCQCERDGGSGGGPARLSWARSGSWAGEGRRWAGLAGRLDRFVVLLFFFFFFLLFLFQILFKIFSNLFF
jgi:hypothetical protein